MNTHRLLRVCLLAALVFPVPATAQDSREGVIAAEQAEKAKNLHPYQPNRAEQLLQQIEDTFVLDPAGFYPYFGSVWSGGGFTLGGGYRQFMGDRINWNVVGLYSIKNYKWIEVGLHSPGTRRGMLDFGIRTGWRDATQVAYYGVGIDSTKDTASNYRFQQGYVSGDLTFRPIEWVIIKGAAGLEDYTLKSGTGSSPSIEEIFTPLTAPGLGNEPRYIHTVASAGIDSRKSADYARTGGLYEVAYHRYDDTEDLNSFDRLDAEIVQHIPFLREAYVLSFHGRLQTVVNGADEIPYFMLPSLGSGDTLRGYSSWRFRDRHAALFSAEWRWVPSRMALDAAFFYDAGVVADELDGLEIGKIKSNVGFGVRFHSPLTTPLRIEVARGDEGLRLVFSGSAAF